MSSRSYHHGDLRKALIQAARTAVESGGPDAVSLRDLAQSLNVSTAAPYRHFTDRGALLAEVAADGFEELGQAYALAQASNPDPKAAARETARAYLGLAFQQPGLFRLMFTSDILGTGAPQRLMDAAASSWEGLHRSVAATMPGADVSEIKRRTLTGWSTLYGFISLVQGGRIRAFMIEPLTEAELLEAVLDKALGAN